MTAIYKLDPFCEYDLHLCRYKNVKNIKDLLKAAKDGNLNCALLNPTIILDPFQIVIAANKTALSIKNNSMITRNIYSEVIYNLSPSKNISKSLSTFGIDGTNKIPENGVDVLVVIMQNHKSQTEPSKILEIIDGECTGISPASLVELRNIPYIKKIYNTKQGSMINSIATICATK